MPLTFPILVSRPESFCKYVPELKNLCYLGGIPYSCIDSSDVDHRPHSAGTILTVLSGGEVPRT